LGDVRADQGEVRGCPVKIEGMTITNFGSFYGEHKLLIAGRALLFVSGQNDDEPRMDSNGAGKSTGTCDALEWGLYGVVPKGDAADSVINEQEGKNCQVDIRLTDGPEYTLDVSRFRKQGGKKSGVRFWVNGEERTALDTKETQRLLELELGLDHQVFRASVVFGQNDRFYFADATDAERQEITTKLFEMEEIDQWLEGAKAIRWELQEQVTAVEHGVVEATAKREAYALSSQSIRDSAAAWEGEQETRHKAAVQRTMELDRYMAETKVRLEALDGVKAQLEEARDISEESFRPAGLADLGLREFELSSQLESLASKQVESPAELAELGQREAVLTEKIARLSAVVVEPPAEIAQLRESQREREALKAECGADWKAKDREVVSKKGEIRHYAKMGVGRCQECGQDVTAEHLQREIARLELNVAGLELERDTIASRGQTLASELEHIADGISVFEVQHRAAEVAHRDSIGPVTAEIVQVREAKLALERKRDEDYAAHQALTAEVNAEIGRVREAVRALDQKMNADLAAHRSAILQLEQQLSFEPTLQGYIEQTTASLVETAANLVSLAEQTNPFKAQLAEVTSELAVLGQLASKAEGLKAEIADRLVLADFWVEAFGPKGVKSYILDTRLSELTAAANEGVLALTGGTMWVQLDTVKAGRTTKTVRNQINLRVFRYNTDGSVLERGYKSWSGGERQRISLGIDFGLAGLVAGRAKKQYHELFLDELFRHLDKGGKEAVVDMLREFCQSKSSIFVIEHDDEFREHFDSELVIQKSHGQSRYAEGAGYDQCVAPVEKKKPRRKKAVRRSPSASSVS